MSIEFIIVGIAIILIFTLLVVLLLMPSENKKKKKKKVQEEVQNMHKEWEPLVTKMESQIQGLHRHMDTLEKDKKRLEKEIAIEQAKNTKLVEKLSQERKWHEQEEQSVDKRTREFKTLKEDLLKVQENYSKEHASNLKLQNEINELKLSFDSLNEQRRTMDTENAQLKAKLDSYRRDLLALKKENAELTKKKEDTVWVAKSEYQRLELLFKEKEKELERIQRETKQP